MLPLSWLLKTDRWNWDTTCTPITMIWCGSIEASSWNFQTGAFERCARGIGLLCPDHQPLQVIDWSTANQVLYKKQKAIGERKDTHLFTQSLQTWGTSTDHNKFHYIGRKKPKYNTIACWQLDDYTQPANNFGHIEPKKNNQDASQELLGLFLTIPWWPPSPLNPCNPIC